MGFVQSLRIRGDTYELFDPKDGAQCFGAEPTQRLPGEDIESGGRKKKSWAFGT
jgi:hypothetical protein